MERRTRAADSGDERMWQCRKLSGHRKQHRTPNTHNEHRRRAADSGKKPPHLMCIRDSRIGSMCKLKGLHRRTNTDIGFLRKNRFLLAPQRPPWSACPKRCL
jgi:hypothetical protein